MAKMPEYATIQAPGIPFLSSVSGSVGSVEVDGPLMFGSFSGSPVAYFAFDTRSGTERVFGELSELDRYAGHPVHLTKAFSFRSSEPSHRRLMDLERAVWFVPPAVCTVFYFLFLLRVRIGECALVAG